ncbi:hypothetical protein [Erwinia tasmaniensis]|uniref:hypothetical protein n=1 Tax=Erwinia tasmaniensis TaxID=338565 RepID=UPI003A4E0B92
MKLSGILAILCLVLPGVGCSQLPPASVFQPKPASTLFTPAAAKCDVSLCQQNCYVQNSQCDRNDSSGCGAKMQACIQSCTSQCH